MVLSIAKVKLLHPLQRQNTWQVHNQKDLHISCSSITLLIDNKSAIRLLKNPQQHKRSKHIDVSYHFIREKFRNGLFDLVYIPTDDQIADIFTKPLGKIKIGKFRKWMGVGD